MDTALRELIDHSKFHQGAVRAVAALLPATDEEMSAAIDETIAAGDQLGFLLLTAAALDGGRRVDAAHLEGGTALAGDSRRLGNLAWKMEGDVPTALMAAMTRSALAREVHAGALFVIAAWCAERRGGELPPGFATAARHLARVKSLQKDAVANLALTAFVTEDEGFLNVMQQNYPIRHRWRSMRVR